MHNRSLLASNTHVLMVAWRQAAALREACVDAAVKHSVALAHLFLVQSSLRIIEILTCHAWNADFATLIAYPPMSCGPLDVSASSMAAAGAEAQDAATSGAPKAQNDLERPPGAVAMAGVRACVCVRVCARACVCVCVCVCVCLCE